MDDLTFSTGLCQSVLDRPSCLEPCADRAAVDSRYLCPVGDCPGFTPECQEADEPPVAALLCMSSPAAVARVVASIVVNSIDRVLFGRARTHVLKKGFKAIAPSWGDGDSPAPVLDILGMIRVFAALDYVTPGMVLSRATHSVRSIEFSKHSGRVLTLKAAATPGASTGKLVSTDNSLFSAIASAQPVGSAGLIKNEADDRQTAEGLARKIIDFGRDGNTLVISHFATSICRLVREALGRSRVRRFLHFNSIYRRAQSEPI